MFPRPLLQQRKATDDAAASTTAREATAEPAGDDRPDRPWLRAAKLAAIVWIGSHLGYLAVNLMAWRVGRMPEPGLRQLLSAWYKWDTGHYVRIAEKAYSASELDPAFFPFYPILIKVFGFVIPGGTQFDALVVANVACFGLLMMLHRLTTLEFGNNVAERTLYFLVAFPTAFFLSAAYNTSIFMLLSISVLYHLRKGSWWTAGLLGVLATATRSSGVLLVLPFAYEYMRQRDFQIRRIRPSILAGGVMFAGIAAFSAYCWYALGDPIAYSTAQVHWGRSFHWPWESLWRTAANIWKGPKLDQFTLTNELDLAAVLFILGLLTLALVGPWKFRRDQAYLIIFGFATAIFPLLFSSGPANTLPIVSMSRHVVEAFPAFMVLAAIGAHRSVERIYILAALPLQAVLLAIFMHYDWVA